MVRSLLFIPGNNPGMLLNADVHGADAIILDLEDAVSPDQKDAARILVRNAVKSLDYKTQLVIRVNPLGTDYYEDDLRAVVPLKPDFVMPTKVDGEEYIKDLDERLTLLEKEYSLEEGKIKIIPLIETAEGIENAFRIAKASKRVFGLFLGAEDYSADLRAHRTKEGDEILYARGRILNAARAAQIEAFDTPFTDVNDEEGLEKDAFLAREMGFTGKAAISPRQVSGINKAFSPTKAEIDYAHEVLMAIEEGIRLGKGAVSLRGKMIDKPIVDRAKRVVETAKILGLGGSENE
ncbi:MAG: HpcH/HpaI aldolase/citrate lyase family protein [Clostridia bacterium]|nr:HpcH/HpaI aldolase/citrate lyase family protein [Clostridia bacterium]